MSAIPEGWKLVPVEPTKEMLSAIDSSVYLPNCYRAMLAAAPQPPDHIVDANKMVEPPVSHASKELTEAQVLDACLSYRHDFGLMSPEEQKRLMFQCKEWHRALSHAKTENQAEPNNGGACVSQPVAVHQFRKAGCAGWFDGFADHEDGGGPYVERTLYAAPQPTKREPLTDEQVDAVVDVWFGSAMEGETAKSWRQRMRLALQRANELGGEA